MVDPQRNNTVQTFPPQRADEPLAERISLWTLGRRLEDLESQVLYNADRARVRRYCPGRGGGSDTDDHLGSPHAAVAASSAPWGAR